MKPGNRKLLLFLLSILMFVGIIFSVTKTKMLSRNDIGTAIDSLNHVKVYYNGKIGNVEGRNISEDDYNIGLKYQCVEFVKRYYLEFYNHKMPDSYGHAKDFFDKSLEDGAKNSARDLVQLKNKSETKPEQGDLLVLKGTIYNRFGHVAIVTEVSDGQIEIIQQNPGIYGKTRESFRLLHKDNKWEIKNKRVLGWLRKE